MRGPGVSRRGKPTPIWVFVLHLSVVFACTWGAMLAFSYGHRVIGCLLAVVWVAAFVITVMDNVRIAAFEWTHTYILVALDRLGITGKTKHIEDKGVHDVQGKPPLSDLDVDQR